MLFWLFLFLKFLNAVDVFFARWPCDHGTLLRADSECEETGRRCKRMGTGFKEIFSVKLPTCLVDTTGDICIVDHLDWFPLEALHTCTKMHVLRNAQNRWQQSPAGFRAWQRSSQPWPWET